MIYLQNQLIEILTDTISRLEAQIERLNQDGMSEQDFERVRFVMLGTEIRLNGLRKELQHERKAKLVTSFNGRSGRHDQAAQTVPG